MNADGTNQQRIGFSDIGDEADPSWSSDGKKITFWSTRINARHLDIYTMNVDGSDVRLLGTNLTAVDDSPSYSPDGAKILFNTNGCAGDLDAANGYDQEICVMNTDGTGQVKLTDNGVKDINPRWSPDGTQIVFESYRDGNAEIYVMDADGSNQRRLTNDAGIDMLPDWGIRSVIAPPVSKLRVVGNKVVNENNEPVILRGVAIADPYDLVRDYYEGPVVRELREEDFRVLAQEWQVNIIRVPIHPREWQSDPAYLEHYLDPITAWGAKYGVYILLGWHAHGNPITGQTEHPMYQPDKALTISALQAMVTRYKNNPWVIYGTLNEPSFITWDEWRPVAEELVDVIQAIDPTAVSLVSGINWGFDLSGVLANPVNRSNVIYETHPYPWAIHACPPTYACDPTNAEQFAEWKQSFESWKNTIHLLAERSPVVLGEWGYGPIEGSQNFNEMNYGKPLTDFCAELGIGWIGWVWHHQWTPAMLTSMDTYATTDFGRFVKCVLTGSDCATGVFDYFMHEDPAHPGRFHDADKTGNNDSYKCHAAASSNLLDWGGLKPSEFADEQQIFGYFQTNLDNKGSLVKYVSRCWIDGTMPPDFGDDWAIASVCPGYFSTGTAQSMFAGAYLSHWIQASLIETITSYLHSGYGVTISLYDSTDSLALGHVLSVWGYRYDAEGDVLGLWVTDSDDVSSEPPQEWLLPIEYSMGSGSAAKWRVSADSEQYTGWLLEGVEALKPYADTTPAAELPRLAIVRKKCVDNDTGEKIACPTDDNVTIYIGDQVCDQECKNITVSFSNSTALLASAKVVIQGTETTFKGWEVNGEPWVPGEPYTLTGDVYVRPVIGRCHH